MSVIQSLIKIINIEEFEGLLWDVGKAFGFVAVCWIVIWLIYRRVNSKSPRLHTVFFERFFRFISVAAAMLYLVFGEGKHRDVLMEIAKYGVIFTGVIVFISQNVIKDVLAGFMMSAYRPFDIGDKIVIPDIPGACIVEDLTMRHVVLQTTDGIRFIVPNSEMNSRIIQHTSYGQSLRATYITIRIGDDTDIPKAISLMRDAAMHSPYTCPGGPSDNDFGGYADVYLKELKDNVLVLRTTIWTEPETDMDFAISEVYQSVLSSFAKNGIAVIIGT